MNRFSLQLITTGFPSTKLSQGYSCEKNKTQTRLAERLMGLTKQQWWPVRCSEYEKLIHGCSEHGFPDSNDFPSVPHSVPISQTPRSTKIKINKLFRYNSRFRVCYPNALQSAGSFDPKIRCQGSYVGYRFVVEHEWSRRPILRGKRYDVCMAPNNMICCPLSGVVNVLLDAKGNDGSMHSLHWNFVA